MATETEIGVSPEAASTADAARKSAAVNLPRALVVEKARKAFIAGKLSLQVSGELVTCKYRDRSGAPCVIGAALSDQDARRFDDRIRRDLGSSIQSLITEGLVTTDDPAFLGELQVAHDHGRLGELRDLLFGDGAPTASTLRPDGDKSGDEQ